MSGENENQVDVLEMSDEEFAALPESHFEEEVVPAAEGEETGDADSGDADGGDGQDSDDAGDDNGDAGDDSDDDGDEDDAGEEGDDTDDSDDSGDDAGDTGDGADDDDDDSGDADDAGDSDPGNEGDDAAVDFEAFYKELVAPFKANGKDMQISNAEDARRLMQMGANYNKKMAGMKPHLKILKTLENAKIDEGQLNYLIDLGNKDPAAIARLVKEAGIDPLTMDLDQGENYTAGDHAANDQEVALDTVIQEIKDSPHYDATLDLVAKQWDPVSKQHVVESPQLLAVINDHMASGVYDLISTEMESERMFGRLAGMSDLDAYKHVGDAIQAKGGFDHLFPEQGQQKPPAKKVVTSKKTADDKARNAKRRAASPTKSTASGGSGNDGLNPLSLSDADFEEQFDSKFL